MILCEIQETDIVLVDTYQTKQNIIDNTLQMTSSNPYMCMIYKI